MRMLVIGDARAPRTAALQRALAAEGWPPADCVAYSSLLSRGLPPIARDTVVRFDAPARDAAEDDALLHAAGAGVPPLRRGELVPRERWFRGFGAALGAAYEHRRSGHRFTAAPNDILTMGDKLATHARLRANGVPSPEFIGEVVSFEQLRASRAERMFLKPVFGSSGAGIVALHLSRKRAQAWTTVELTDGALFNTRVLRIERCETRIAKLVDALCARDRMFAERWVAKRGSGGKQVDLRVVVAGGEVVRVVVRASSGPITNLHLQNERRDAESLRVEIEAEVWETAMQSCVRAARCFPTAVAVGVDVAFTARGDGHRVFEVNAFGDYVRTADDDGTAVFRRELQVLAR